uniref:Putative secreted protein n=1 Tax=Ixodes ricinus TaxID=34613 RepID=A0A6B0U5U7_IXORI
MQHVATLIMLRCLMQGVDALVVRPKHNTDRPTHTQTQAGVSSCDGWRSQNVSWLPEHVLFVFRAGSERHPLPDVPRAFYRVPELDSV